MELASSGLPEKQQSADIALTETQKIQKVSPSRITRPLETDANEAIDTLKLPILPLRIDMPTLPLAVPPRTGIRPRRALVLAMLLLILVLHAINMGSTGFIGPQGWAYIVGGPASTNDTNLLQTINQDLRHHHGSTLGTTAQPTLTPQQYIDIIMQRMTLNQKLGQMMIVQFVGPSYSLDVSTMISQYSVGAILLSAANENIVERGQLKGLTQQMQSNSPVPLIIATDQEGGTVDRLKSLDGPRPSATSIGMTNDPNKALQAGIQDAKDLSYYGINLNLAPVIDVTNIYNPQLDQRTYGNNTEIVTKMATAYLQGLQQSGNVFGTLKHFPGLGDVAADPHNSVPYLNRSYSDLEAIDWAPYRALLKHGDIYSIMVTHEIVRAIDSTKPSSLSNKVVTGILRNELGYQGVIMTDSLTMEGITANYTPAQATVLAVEAGSDLLMGATDLHSAVAMIEGLKQAIQAGNISMQRIDDSVRRLLMLKYQMGLLHIPVD